MLTQPRIPTSSQQHLPTCTPRSTCFIKCPSKSSASRLTSALSPHHQQQRSATRRDVLVATAAASTMGTQPSTTTSGKLNTHDLLIVGPGVLGSYLGAQWKGQYGDATVVAQTNSTTNHARLEVLGLMPRTKDAASGDTYPFVLFAAPPSGSEDYVGEIKAALARWNGQGTFVFTSSAGVYQEASSEGALPVITENSPVAKDNPRQQRLLEGEEAVLEAGGCVVRLVGLYHSSRGPHTFFAKMGTVERWGGYTVNLIHYQDAAHVAAAILRGDGCADGYYRSRVFLGADNHPVTFDDMMQAYFASVAVPEGGSVTFTGSSASGGSGKRVDASATYAMLGWKPTWESFAAFFGAGEAKDWYAAQQDGVKGSGHV